jgi:hypothetical protein
MANTPNTATAPKIQYQQIGSGYLTNDSSKAGQVYAGAEQVGGHMVGDSWEVDPSIAARKSNVIDALMGTKITQQDINEAERGPSQETITAKQAAQDEWAKKKFGTSDIYVDYGDSSKGMRTSTIYANKDGKYVNTGISLTSKDANVGDAASILGVLSSPLTATFAPGLSEMLGGGALGKIGANAIIGGTTSALTGGNPLKGAVAGGLSGATPALTGALTPVFGDAATMISRAAIGGAKAAITGADPITGILTNMIPGNITGNQAIDSFMSTLFKGQITKSRAKPIKKGP